jgi:hypothetical protein
MSSHSITPSTKFAHLNSTLTTVTAAQTFPANTNFISIFNSDSTNNVLISFDGDVTTFPLLPLGNFSFDCNDFKSRNTLNLKSSASTIAVKIVYGYEV